ncbi:MAG: RluA family pseudouridine synthase [Lautropia sp.]|nr:RluA family pseudouridine synthase [Lautropia sp.]
MTALDTKAPRWQTTGQTTGQSPGRRTSSKGGGGATGASGAQAGVQWLSVDEAHAGQRLDNYLLAVLRGLPKTRIYRMIRKGEVRVNGGRCKAEQRVLAGDRIRVPPLSHLPETARRPGPARGGQRLDARHIRIVFEDEHLLVVEKSAGLAVHGGSGISAGLIERLRASRPEGAFLELAHRLDRDTSGLLIIAKRRAALVALHRMFAEGEVHKQYLALVKGHWGRREPRLLQFPLLRYLTPEGERRVKVVAEGQPSATRVSRQGLIDTGGVPGMPPHCSLLRCELLTGRTHQIRVHLAHAGHPILGDEKYGDFTLNKQLDVSGHNRMFLHAFYLEMKHPVTGAELQFQAPMPEAFERFIQAFGDSHP